MRNQNMTKKSCLRTLLIIAIGYFAFWYIGNWHYLKEKERSLIGTYQLDLNRTDMGIYKDSMDCFKDLKVEFRSDGTFKMNMEVPFILSSTGTWKVGGMNRWNTIRYDTAGLEDQISQPYLNENDTVFYINSVTPKKSERYRNGVNVVYFKKIK
jgi:hypothetical protein